MTGPASTAGGTPTPTSSTSGGGAVASRDTFLAWLSQPAGSSWVDVGCGTGALSAQIVARMAPGQLLGVDPSADFVAAARALVPDPVASFAVGSADRLPADTASADVVVSGLVLNFVPDVAGALGEARRVARDGGVDRGLRLGLRRADGADPPVLGRRGRAGSRRRGARRGDPLPDRPAGGPGRGLGERGPATRSSSTRSTSRPGSRASTSCGRRSRRPSGRRPATPAACRRTGATSSVSASARRSRSGPTAPSTSSRAPGRSAGALDARAVAA